MNILIIPSWYPWPGAPQRGIFFKEQAVCLGRMRPGWKIAVAVWGQRRYTLSLRNPLATLRVLADFLRSVFGKRRRGLLPNVWEYRQPAIEWTRRWGQGNIRGMVRACRRILRRAGRDLGRVDLIHAHVTFPGGWIAMALSQESALPYVITEHWGNFPAPEFLGADGALKEIIAAPLRGARALAAVSPFLAERIAERGFPRPRVIPNMVDDDFFTPGTPVKKEAGLFIFFALGALKPAKGVGDLLEALAIWLRPGAGRQAPGIQLRIGGAGKMKSEWSALARRLEIEPWVRWLGPLGRERVLEEFRACDCFVQPSHRESFSIVLLEALACGKPVIATRCGGPESFVTPANGMLVGVHEPADLARAMDEMTRTAHRFDGPAIRRDIMKTYSPASVSVRIEALYHDALAQAPR